MSHLPALITLGPLLTAACWAGVVVYSRRTYTKDACRACEGTGRDMEPRWMALARLSIHRRWRDCPAGDGRPVYDLRER